LKDNIKRLTLLSFLLIYFGCTKDEEKVPDPITTDISVNSSTNLIIYENVTDLDNKLDGVLTYDFGNAAQNEIDIKREYNSEFSSVTISITFKNEFANKYADQNLENNIIIINLRESEVIAFEGDGGDVDFNLGAQPWISCNITFSFFDHTNDLGVGEQELLFLEAGLSWTNQVPSLNFINLGHNNENALLRIHFVNEANHPPCPSRFSSNRTIAHAFYPNTPNLPIFSGDIHFNDTYNYTNGSIFETDTDFFSIAVHEIGHSVGIAHNPELQESIMFPTYSTGSIKRILAQDDINAINSLYANNCSGNSMSNISLSGNIDFRNVEINTSSEIEKLRVSNNGTKSFNIVDITSSDSAFTILNTQSRIISAGDYFDFNIQFRPTEEKNYTGTITVENNADNADSQNSSIQVFGTGIPVEPTESIISLSGNLDFQEVLVDETASRNLIISNTGNAGFTVTSISTPEGFSSNFSGTIPPNSSIEAPISFSPTSAQNYGGELIVNSNATNNDGNNTYNISGIGFVQNSGFSDLIVEDIWLEAEEEVGVYDIRTRIKNIGDAATPSNETIKLNYYINGQFIDDDTHSSLASGEDREEFENNYQFESSGTYEIRVEIESVSNETNTGNNSLTVTKQVTVDGQPQGVDLGSNIPSNSCNDNPYRLDLNTNYYLTSFDARSEIGLGNDNRRGMWYRFRTDSIGFYTIRLGFTNTSANTGFMIFAECDSQNPVIVDERSDNLEAWRIYLAANKDYYIRFYDINDTNPLTLAISINQD